MSGRDTINADVYEYDGCIYPTYLKNGNACQFIEPFAKSLCRGIGLDVGCGDWPLKGARPIDLKRNDDAMALPDGEWDYIFSSHLLEHLPNYVAAIEHWKTRIRAGGVLFLYLPHSSMKYWQPTRNRKHLHTWEPAQMADILRELGFVSVMHSERDLAWSFATVGWKA